MQLQVLPIRLRLLLLALAVLAAAGAATAHGERTQRGNLIVSLDGKFSPLALPRDRPAPVAVQLRAGLRTSDASVLPRVTKVELGIPGQGVITTRGLPTCGLRRIRDATAAKALEACGSALIGTGEMVAQVKIPSQDPFEVHARLLAFNGRVGDHRAVMLHGISTQPPSAIVIPFVIRLRPGKFGTVLVAHVPENLGPWPRFAHFEMNLFRRYVEGGKRLSYLSASCPIPRSNTAGFFSFAKATFTLADGRRISTGIARSCRAR
ncbi:MAG TPA: hypothetical protein VFN92_09945 [Solirubrobacterales bacterium]|nr:hypothetical protein [Solirubrobacterales bacterium]